jgi:hypothetical protein
MQAARVSDSAKAACKSRNQHKTRLIEYLVERHKLETEYFRKEAPGDPNIHYSIASTERGSAVKHKAMP